MISIVMIMILFRAFVEIIILTIVVIKRAGKLPTRASLRSPCWRHCCHDWHHHVVDQHHRVVDRHRYGVERHRRVVRHGGAHHDDHHHCCNFHVQRMLLPLQQTDDDVLKKLFSAKSIDKHCLFVYTPIMMDRTWTILFAVILSPNVKYCIKTK